MTTAASRYLLIAASVMLLTGLLAVGCGGPPQTVYDQPSIPDGYWETAWVDPEIVITNTEFTLIKAQRVDSIWIQYKNEPIGSAPSIHFVVPEPCFVTVRGGKDYGTNMSPLMRMLIARNLPAGAYKMTFNTARDETSLKWRSWELEGTVCGKVSRWIVTP